MKTPKYILCAAVLLALCGCNLHEDPDYFTERRKFFRNENQCRAAVDACYNCINPIYTSRFQQITESCSDIGLTWSSLMDPALDVTPAYPRFGATVWKQGYRGVMYCNYAIAGIENSDIDAAKRDRLVAEAKILRAFYYYILTCTFGDVPYYTVDVATKAILKEVQRLPRTSAVEIRRNLIADLEPVVPALDRIRGSDESGNCVGAALGWMMIAKLAMWNGSKDTEQPAIWWDKAIDALEALRDIYGPLSGYPLEENYVWWKKNTPESIYEIQHKYVHGGVNFTSSVAPAVHPSHTTGTLTYDGVEIEWLGDNGVTWAQLRPTVYFCRTLQPKGGLDRRTQYNLAWDYEGQTFKSVGGRPWVGIKLWCPDMNNYYDHNNYKIFRYADALLMLAECYAEADMPADAVACLNEVKERAGLETYVYSSYEQLIDEIRDERARELFGEFHRKFDLVRWGIWYERLMEYNERTDMLANARPCHEYYPIPDVQVEYSGGALSNDEYKKYGL